MEFEEARPFMESNHPGVISTYQRNGAIHNSIVVCGIYLGALDVRRRGWFLLGGH